MTEPIRTKCPVPHEVDRNFSVVPLDCCGLCGGTGYIDPMRAITHVVLEGQRVELHRAEVLGMIWLCDCPIFYRSKACPPFCEHSIKACKAVSAMQGNPA